jgi:hypothetical protein
MAVFPLMEREFPDFDQTTLPAIPAEWEDCSWHNEPCPCFKVGETGLYVFTDYAKPEDRDVPELKRFVLIRIEGGPAEDLAASDDFAEIITAIENTPPL